MGWYQDWKAGKPLNSTDISTTPRRRLRCKYCHSDDLTIVTEYHKELRLRFYRDLLKKCKLFIIVLATIFFISHYTLEVALANVAEFFIAPPFLIWVILSIIVSVLTVIIDTRESHTHIRLICHSCAHSWVCD